MSGRKEEGGPFYLRVPCYLTLPGPTDLGHLSRPPSLAISDPSGTSNLGRGMGRGVLMQDSQKALSHLFLLTEFNFLAQDHNPAAPTTETGKKEEVRGLERQERRPTVSPASKACWLVAEIDSRINAALACSIPPPPAPGASAACRAGGSIRSQLPSRQQQAAWFRGLALTC